MLLKFQFLMNWKKTLTCQFFLKVLMNLHTIYTYTKLYWDIQRLLSGVNLDFFFQKKGVRGEEGNGVKTLEKFHVSSRRYKRVYIQQTNTCTSYIALSLFPFSSVFALFHYLFIFSLKFREGDGTSIRQWFLYLHYMY